MNPSSLPLEIPASFPSSLPSIPEFLAAPCQSRRYYFLSEEADEGDELRQRCLDLERQVGLRWGQVLLGQGYLA